MSILHCLNQVLLSLSNVRKSTIFIHFGMKLEFSCNSALKGYQENFQFKNIIYYSSFAMGGNTLLRKSSVLDLPIRKSTCLRQTVRRIFQGWFNPRMGFHLALTTLAQDGFLLDKAQQSRSTRGVSFPKVSISDHCLSLLKDKWWFDFY